MSAPRVYLMADFGKGPRSLGSYSGASVASAGDMTWSDRAASARRWWLVEAESADHARKAIERWDVFKLSHPIHESGETFGRILESGGAA